MKLVDDFLCPSCGGQTQVDKTTYTPPIWVREWLWCGASPLPFALGAATNGLETKRSKNSKGL